MSRRSSERCTDERVLFFFFELRGEKSEHRVHFHVMTARNEILEFEADHIRRRSFIKSALC
jgi:hypothetical protein